MKRLDWLDIVQMVNTAFLPHDIEAAEMLPPQVMQSKLIECGKIEIKDGEYVTENEP